MTNVLKVPKSVFKFGTQAIATCNERRVDACQDILRRCDGMVKHFSSESSLGMRVVYTTYKPERKRQSMEWRHTSSPKSKKVQMQRCAGTVMLTFFWDNSGTILEHYLPRGSTVTSATYSILRKNLKPAIRQKRRGLLTRGGVSS